MYVMGYLGDWPPAPLDPGSSGGAPPGSASPPSLILCHSCAPLRMVTSHSRFRQWRTPQPGSYDALTAQTGNDSIEQHATDGGRFSPAAAAPPHRSHHYAATRRTDILRSPNAAFPLLANSA